MINTSLRVTLLTWFISLVLLPLLIFLFLGHYYLSQFFLNLAYENLHSVADKQVHFINQWFENKMTTIRYISQCPEVRNKNIEWMEKYFHHIWEINPEYNGFAFVDVNGRNIVDTTGQTGINLSDRDYFIAAKAGKEYISDVLISRRTGKPVIVFSVPIFENKQFQGLVFGSVSMQRIGQIMRGDQKKQEQETYLVNRKGYLITQSRYSKDLVKLGYIGESYILKHKPNTIGVSKALTGESGVGEYKDYRGEDVIGAYYWLPDRQWALIAEIDKEMAFAPIYKQYKVSLIILSSAILLFMIVFNLFLVRRLANPLIELSDMATQIASGNFEMRIKKFTQKNEIGILANSFNQMADSLEKQKQTNQQIMQQLSEKNKQLKALAITDSLTGLYNKGYLLKRLESEFQRSIRYREILTVVMLDIDHFKKVNDTYGHLAGDKVLRELAALIANSIRKSDILARYGGEEFTLIAPHTSLQEGINLAEKLRKIVENFCFQTAEGTAIPITISLGVSTFQGAKQNHIIEKEISQVLENADKALYQAKANGRNRVERLDFSV